MTARSQAETGVDRLHEGEPAMKGARPPHTPEEVAAKLRRVGELVGQGLLVAEAVRAVGVSDSTYYRWRAARRAQAGMQTGDQGAPSADPDRERRLRRLEVENTRLRRAVADLAIEKQALKETASDMG